MKKKTHLSVYARVLVYAHGDVPNEINTSGNSKMREEKWLKERTKKIKKRKKNFEAVVRKNFIMSNILSFPYAAHMSSIYSIIYSTQFVST